ncbi:MAG: ABC transporter ATP-binding protein [Polyangiaceae bacterium]|nr:ABC transporter ATP-binding protein [Polyangiaceae bacterium]
MIACHKLCKDYGSFRALKNLSFEVARGEVVGFLGPNGAGKSTTLRILSGFLGPTSGDARINGHSIVDEPIVAKSMIGYMPEAAPLYTEMRVGEYLLYRAELKGVARASRKTAVSRVIADAGLDGMDGVLIGHLSKGYRQRVGLADALVASPPLLILDEPTAGLDPNQIREVRALISRLKEKHTILVSTHILSEVEAMCDKGVLIARGELIAQGTLAELRALRRPRAVRIRIRGDASAAKKALVDIQGAGETTIEDSADRSRLSVSFSDPDDADATTARIVAALSRVQIGVVEVVPSSSLEQVFADLTARAPTATAGDAKKRKGQR